MEKLKKVRARVRCF